MKIKPVKEYEKPKYRTFMMKNGKPLAAGLACIAMAGSLAGCGAGAISGELTTIIPTTAIPTTTFEALDGDLTTMPELSPQSQATPLPTEMLLGFLEVADTPTPESEQGGFEALDGVMPAPSYDTGE